MKSLHTEGLNGAVALSTFRQFHVGRVLEDLEAANGGTLEMLTVVFPICITRSLFANLFIRHILHQLSSRLFGCRQD
jgi:hypothetical protein